MDEEVYEFRSTTSRLPSWFKSARIVLNGADPAADERPDWKVPSPLPRMTVIVPALNWLAMTKSAFPSWLTSPTSTSMALAPAAKFAGGLNVPSPRFMRTMAVPP